MLIIDVDVDVDLILEGKVVVVVIVVRAETTPEILLLLYGVVNVNNNVKVNIESNPSSRRANDGDVIRCFIIRFCICYIYILYTVYGMYVLSKYWIFVKILEEEMDGFLNEQ